MGDHEDVDMWGDDDDAANGGDTNHQEPTMNDAGGKVHDDEEDADGEGEEDGMDMFGDGDEEEAEPGEDDLAELEREKRRQLEYEERDLTGISQPEKRIGHLTLPNLSLPYSSDGKLWHARLPHFLRLQALPFDESTWDKDLEDEMNGGEVPDESVIRWRWKKAQDGSMHRNSNGRYVRWSDGSLSLILGNEYYDVHTSENQKEDTGEITGVTTYLVAQQREAELGEAHAYIDGTMTFLPAALSSKAHRRLAKNVTGKHVKTQQTKVHHVEKDLEIEQRLREEAEARKQKGGARRRAVANNDGVGRTASSRRRPSARSRRIDLPSEGEEEDEEDMAGFGGGGASRRREEEDDEDDDGFVVDDDEEAADAEGDTEEEDLDAAADEAYRREREGKTQSSQSQSNSQPTKRITINDDEE